jgi:hypothetical protein
MTICAGIQPFWWSEFRDSDWTLSDFGTAQISVVVDCFNVKVDHII